eukprot:TRINITY_DN3654_c0_g1_i1.p1 TRINITY_DN3654_c0_g1~~TRINITY_DN3654_c0_g1_i1.p1  ORF type:complete len:269 (+),score=13.37 TRINITY_DN3654_c0_g1_i1:229-1035(+)
MFGQQWRECGFFETSPLPSHLLEASESENKSYYYHIFKHLYTITSVCDVDSSHRFPPLRVDIGCIGPEKSGSSMLCYRFAMGRFEAYTYTRMNYWHSDLKTRQSHGQSILLHMEAKDYPSSDCDPIMRKEFYMGPGCMVAFSLTSRQQFDEISKLLPAVLACGADDQLKPRRVVFLVGTMADLVQDRAVSNEEARALADSHGVEYFETSAKDDEASVRKVFFEMASQILRLKMGGHWGGIPKIEPSVPPPKPREEKVNLFRKFFEDVL